MSHFTEEQLIEYHFHQTSDGFEDHLKTCPECAASYAALKSDMATP